MTPSLHKPALGMLALALAAAIPGLPSHAQGTAGLYPELQTFTQSLPSGGQAFGKGVALDGDTLVIGNPGADIGGAFDRGSVQVFVRSGAAWILQAALTDSDGEAGDRFGHSVALSDGRLVVGAPEDDVAGAADRGSVHVFVRAGSSWSKVQTISAGDAGDHFGHSVALSGNALVVGAPFADFVGASAAGSTWVYAQSGDQWVSGQQLSLASPRSYDQFGWSVAVSGNTLAAGSPYRDSLNGSQINVGTVAVYSRPSSGSPGAWTLQAELIDAAASSEQYFGYSVALSGEALAAGAPVQRLGAGAVIGGCARIYGRTGTAWTLQATLVPAGAEYMSRFGDSVAMDGNLLVVGMPLDQLSPLSDRREGSTRVYARIGSAWEPQATLVAGNNAFSSEMGTSVAMSGNLIATGAPGEFATVGTNLGTVCLFGNYRVYNETRQTVHASLVAAIGAGFAGDRLLTDGLAFGEASGIVDSSAKPFAFVALEPLVLSADALMTVAPGTVFEKAGTAQAGGLTVAGKLVAPASGTVTFEQLSVGDGGQFLQRGSTVLVNQVLSTLAGGDCYLQGTVLAESVSTAVGGQNRVAGDTDVFADYVNAGSTVIQRGILYIYGSLTNTGTMSGEYDTGFLPPNEGDGYSIGGDYVVAAGSTIALPDPVWWLRVGGNFDVAIDSPSRFAMAASTLELTGLAPAADQAVEVLSADLGAVEDGFEPENFPIGTLRVRAGTTVLLVDAHDNAGGAGVEAVYLQGLFVPAGATLVTGGHRVYTRAATIAGTVSNPEDIVIVPGTPPCTADLYRDGVVNGADLAALLSSWGPCPPGSCPADLTGDGLVNGADLAGLLSAWGPCP